MGKTIKFDCPVDGCMGSMTSSNLKQHLLGFHKWSKQKVDEWNETVKLKKAEKSGKSIIK